MNLDVFIDRILELLINPSHEWEKIEQEEIGDPWRYLLKHLGPFILLNIASYFIGAVFVGSKTQGISNSQYLSVGQALFTSIFLATIYIVVIYVGAVIVKLIATSFDSEQNKNNSFKLVVFSLYPYLIFGSLHIIPSIKIGAWAGFYGAYLLYTGLPVLLKTPQARSAGFTLVVALAVTGMLALAFSLINMVSGAGLNFRLGL
jgi:hypothetical protein